MKTTNGFLLIISAAFFCSFVYVEARPDFGALPGAATTGLQAGAATTGLQAGATTPGLQAGAATTAVKPGAATPLATPGVATNGVTPSGLTNGVTPGGLTNGVTPGAATNAVPLGAAPNTVPLIGTAAGNQKTAATTGNKAVEPIPGNPYLTSLSAKNLKNVYRQEVEGGPIVPIKIALPVWAKGKVIFAWSHSNTQWSLFNEHQQQIALENGLQMPYNKDMVKRLGIKLHPVMPKKH